MILNIRAAVLFVAACVSGCQSDRQSARDETSVSSLANETISAAATVSADQPFREIRQGVFEFGEITIDSHRRSVSFPARMNMTGGAMEYFLVTTWGKVHESVLLTETEPKRLHIAMLLIGAKGVDPGFYRDMELSGEFILNPSSVRLPGDAMDMEIRWMEQGKLVRCAAEELVLNQETKSVMKKDSWVYNGSILTDEIFLADREGSIVSLVTDPLALANNISPGHDNQAIWIANTNRIPPVNTAVEVTIRLRSK